MPILSLLLLTSLSVVLAVPSSSSARVFARPMLRPERRLSMTLRAQSTSLFSQAITALAVALKQATTPEFKQYQEQVVKNAKALEVEFKKLGYKLVADGTDSHMVLLDLRPQALDGARVEAVLEQVNIACNKNSIPGDKSAPTPCGIRIGTPAMTSRGFGEEAFIKVADYIDQCIKICKEVQGALPKSDNKLKDFKAKVAGGEVEKINEMRKEIAAWAGSFPLPVEGWRV